MLNSFWPILQGEASVLKDWGSFAVECLSNPLRGAVHLRGIRFCGFPDNTVLKKELSKSSRDVFPAVIIAQALDNPPEVWALMVLLKIDKTVRNLPLSLDKVDRCKLCEIASERDEVTTIIIAFHRHWTHYVRVEHVHLVLTLLDRVVVWCSLATGSQAHFANAVTWMVLLREVDSFTHKR
jgi:hypothetical protein